MRRGLVSNAGLGFWMATALVIGNMIGSGIFLLPSALAPYGGISIVGWIFTAIGAMLLALVFARLARAYPKTGGPYAYSRLAFGDFVGFQTAWGYWISIWVGNAAIAVAFAGYLAVFWPEVGANPLLGALVALAAIWLLTGVNALGVRAGGWVQAVTTVVKLVPLVAIGVIGLFRINRANFQPFNPSGESNFAAVTAVAALTLWAFIGLESATVPAEDVADPERVIPRSTILGTAIAAVVYILGTIAVLGTVPLCATRRLDRARSATPASAIFGGWAGPASSDRRALLDVWLSQRLDPAPGPDPAGRGQGWSLPRRLQPAQRGRRAGGGAVRLQRPGHHPRRDELRGWARRPLHVRHPAGDPGDADPLRLCGDGRVDALRHRPVTLQHPQPDGGRCRRPPRLRLRLVGDRRRRRRRRPEGHAPVPGRYPRLSC